MIITVTGKPCSGKGTVSKLFCKKYNFKYVCTGDIFREYAKKFGYSSVLEFQQKADNVKQVDMLVDSYIENLGKTSINENILIDSRLAWHFIPNSFKVYIDVSWEEAGKRLHDAKRENEKTETPEHASKILQERWKVENDRYLELYNTNNLNLFNYDLVISSENKTPDKICEIIHSEYLKIVQ